MQSRNHFFLQKLKANGFYVALGVGLLAVMAAVAVYTVDHGGLTLAGRDGETDYGLVSREEEPVLETNAKPIRASEKEARTNEAVLESSLKKEREQFPAAEAEKDVILEAVAGQETGASAGTDGMPVMASAGTDAAATGGNGTSAAGVGPEGTPVAAGSGTEGMAAAGSGTEGMAASGTAVETGQSGMTTASAETDGAAVGSGAEPDKLPVTADAGQLDFTSDKTLTWPVKGEVILPYSMKTTVYFKTLDQYRCNPGMLIAAGNGTTVKNAYLGKVTKVTSDNTYGNMVTVYLGNDYSVVYGQLDMIYVKEGDHVKAGASIGTIGNPTDCFQAEGSHLFFQMLKGDEPVDPMGFME